MRLLNTKTFALTNTVFYAATHILLFSFFLCTLPVRTGAQTVDTSSTNFAHQAAVQELSGTVEFQQSGTGSWKPVKVGTPLKMDDRVRTGSASSCRILIGDVGHIELAASTEARLGSLRQVRGKTEVRDVIVIHLERGLSRQAFNKRPGRMGDYKVASPVCVAGVRGTSFEMGLDELLKNLYCAVLDGSVDLSGSAGGSAWSRTVSAGNGLKISSDVQPSQAIPADPEALQRLWSILTASQQDTTLPIIPEPKPGEGVLEIAPTELPLITAGKIEATFQGKKITVSSTGGAFAPKTVAISFGGSAANLDAVLDVGKDFTFKRTFEAYPISLEASGNVSTAGGKTTITFTSIKATYFEEAAMDVYKIPCALIASPGGAGLFILTVSPGDEVEVE